VSQTKRGHFSFVITFTVVKLLSEIFEARNFADFSASTDVQ